MLTLAAVTHPSTAPHASPHFPASPLNSSLVSKNPLSWSLASANDSRDKSSLILRVFSNLYCGFVNKGAFPTTFTIDLHRKYRLLKGKKRLSWFLSLLKSMENLSSRLSGVSINVLIALLLAVWSRMVHSSGKSVQTFLFSSVGFELGPLQSWVRGQEQQ